MSSRRRPSVPATDSPSLPGASAINTRCTTPSWGCRLAAAITLASIAGCSALPTPPSEQPVSTFRFEPEIVATQAQADGAIRISVSRPRAAAEFATPRLAYTQRDFEVLYYASNEWVSEPAAMLESVLIKALSASGGFAAVLSEADARLSNQRLDVDLLELTHDLRTEPATARMAVRVQLVDLDNGRLLGMRILEHSEPVVGEGPYAGVKALNTALGLLLADVVRFARGGRQ